MSRPETVQRLQYAQGQLLASGDLRDELQRGSRLRGVHVQAVHGVWGVALGCEVTTVTDRRGVRVGPGLAYDACGRELLLDAPQRLAVPAAGLGASDEWLDLMLRHDAGARPRLRWSPAADLPQAAAVTTAAPGFGADVRLGEDVPLARVRLGADGRIARLDRELRRVARSLARPQLANGRLASGAVGISGTVWDWTAWIDTTAAGLGTPQPCYFACLADHPFLSPASGFATVFLASGLDDARRRLLGPFISVEGASRTGFTLRVRTAAASHDTPSAFTAPLLAGLRLPVPVEWFGIDLDANGPADGAAL